MDVTLTWHTWLKGLEKRLPVLFERTSTAGMVWVCWPKKASKLADRPRREQGPRPRPRAGLRRREGRGDRRDVVGAEVREEVEGPLVYPVLVTARAGSSSTQRCHALLLRARHQRGARPGAGPTNSGVTLLGARAAPRAEPRGSAAPGAGGSRGVWLTPPGAGSSCGRRSATTGRTRQRPARRPGPRGALGEGPRAAVPRVRGRPRRWRRPPPRGDGTRRARGGAGTPHRSR